MVETSIILGDSDAAIGTAVTEDAGSASTAPSASFRLRCPVSTRSAAIRGLIEATQSMGTQLLLGFGHRGRHDRLMAGLGRQFGNDAALDRTIIDHQHAGDEGRNAVDGFAVVIVAAWA